MLDSQVLKKNLEEFTENLKKRDISVDVSLLIELDEKRRKAKFEAEQVKAQQNKLGKEIPKADKKEKEELLEKASELSDNFKKFFLLYLNRHCEIMTTLQSLSLNQTITKIDELIDSGNGDVGRLYHILEFLKNKKMLYKTDRTYLETKLNSSFEVEEKIIEDVKTEDEKELLPQIKKLIKNKDGDVGRLQHISDMIIQHRELFRTDLDYLKSKISPDDKVITPPKISDTKQSSQTSSKQNNLKTELTPKPKIRGSMPKGWSPKTNEIELNDISKNIEDEKEKILQQQKISNELNSKKLKLIELMDHRKKYEQDRQGSLC